MRNNPYVANGITYSWIDVEDNFFKYHVIWAQKQNSIEKVNIS